MPAIRPILARLGLAAAALAAGVAATPVPEDESTKEPEARPGRLTLVDRVVAHDQRGCQAWQVDYTWRYDGPAKLVARPTEVSAEVRGWVSNSRVASHATPRFSALTISGASGLSASAEVIHTSDPDQCCRERGVLQVWAGAKGSSPPDPIAKAGVRLVAPEEQPTLEVAPGGTVRVRLRLEHDHFLYGPYDPLLGPRTLELHLGAVLLRDDIALDRPRPPVPADPAWDHGAPSDRLDARYFVSAPDSLHLEAHVPGNQSHCFRERQIRYATRYRLSFWYLVAPGTEGVCRVRLSQYRDGCSTWRPLSEGDFQKELAVIGRWTRVDHLFRTERDATTLRLEFRINDADLGDLWIDDVRLEQVGETPEGP